MIRFACIATLVLAVLALGPVPANAVDQGVVGQKIVIKRSASGKEKMVLVLKDPALIFPTIGGPDDPSVVGMQVELFSRDGGTHATFVIPPGLGKPGWKAKIASRSSYAFSNREAPDGISEVKTARIKEGKMVKVVARRTGLLLDAPQGAVGVRVTTGSLRSCTLFDAPTIQRDEPGQFKARKAERILPTCDDLVLDGIVECGDGLPDAPEECDGPATCPTNFDCQPAGSPDECTCSQCGTCPGIYGCCGPAIFLPAPGGGCAGSCLATSCAPPYECNPGSQCLPDETCCTPPGNGINLCYFSVFQMDLLPCCPGSTCSKPSSFGLECCVADGDGCSSDEACCSDSCTGGTCDSCLPLGAACSEPLRCCSFNCGASGTCECAPTAYPCTSSGQCCSGSCSPSGACNP